MTCKGLGLTFQRPNTHGYIVICRGMADPRVSEVRVSKGKGQGSTEKTLVPSKPSNVDKPSHIFENIVDK